MFLARLSRGGRLRGSPVRLTAYARPPGSSSMGDDRFVFDPAIASFRSGLVMAWAEQPGGQLS